MSSNWKSDPIFDEDHRGFNMIVHTLSNRLQAASCLNTLGLTHYQLSWISDSHLLTDYLSDFFKSDNS